MNISLDSAEAVSRWYAVNDGVMGGLSSGGPEFKDGHLVFSGTINTNGGGFSSIRANVERGVMAGKTGLKYRIKSDGRIYRATFRTGERYGWREVSFQMELPPTQAGN